MSRKYGFRLFGLCLLGLTLLAPMTALGDDVERARTVDGLDIYLGIISVAAIRAQPEHYAGETMHGGIPQGRHMQHVLVTLFDH